MDIRTLSLKNIITMESTLTTDKEREFYNAIYKFLNEIHNPVFCIDSF